MPTFASGFVRRTSSCGNSSVGRAQPCQGWGREFESRFPLATKRHLKGVSFLLRSSAVHRTRDPKGPLSGGWGCRQRFAPARAQRGLESRFPLTEKQGAKRHPVSVRGFSAASTDNPPKSPFEKGDFCCEVENSASNSRPQKKRTPQKGVLFIACVSSLHSG